jgi:aspartokinase
MKVLKFEGNSIASASKMKATLHLIDKKEKCIVVFSALAGTSRMLTEISD